MYRSRMEHLGIKLGLELALQDWRKGSLLRPQTCNSVLLARKCSQDSCIASDDEENFVNQTVDNMSWAAYLRSHQPAGWTVICPSARLPLFHESAHTVAMVKHSMDSNTQVIGWVEALVPVDITTAGTADSFLRAAHVARTRHSHQPSAAALYFLQYRAYNNRDIDTEDEPLGFDEWCSKKEESYP